LAHIILAFGSRYPDEIESHYEIFAYKDNNDSKEKGCESSKKD
jgi:hypothetical protein